MWDLDNVIVAPHIAALTIECVIRMATTVARNVEDVLEGRRPEFVESGSLQQIRGGTFVTGKELKAKLKRRTGPGNDDF